MRESKETSRAITEVRGATPRGFSGGVTAEERHRKALETRLRNLSNKRAAQGFLHAAEEKMFRHLTRVMRAKRTDRVRLAFSAAAQRRNGNSEIDPEPGLKNCETSIVGATRDVASASVHHPADVRMQIPV